jgi:hypothetical protein
MSKPPVKSVRMPSEDAPFYGFFPLTDARESLASRMRYPLTPEEEALKRARHERLLELGAESRLDLISQTNLPLEPHLIEKKVRAKGAKLKKIAHWNCYWAVTLLGGEWHTDFHQVVSPEWKDVMESLEPGVHQFFPFTIEFDKPENDNVYAAFVMRDRVWITDHQPDRFLGYQHKITDTHGTWKGHPKEFGEPWPEVTLKFSRTAVTGRHWFRAGPHQARYSVPIIVSKALLERLLPLVPHESYFIPTYVA